MEKTTIGNRFKLGKKTKKIIKTIKIVICSFLALIIVGGLFFSYYIGKQVADGILYQNAENDTKSNSIKQLEKWGYSRVTFETSYQSNKSIIIAEDGNVIPVTRFSMDDDLDKNTVIIVHGAGGDYVSTYPQAEVYLKNDWNVVTFDQRASGDSENDYVTFGYFEKIDLKALVDYVREKAPYKKVVIHGLSMGAATTGLYLATEHAAKNVDYAVLDSSFENMESMFLGVWGEMGTGLPGSYAVWCGDWYLKKNYGFKFEDADVVRALAINYVPTLVIQGIKDELCTEEMGKKIFESIATDNKEYWLVDSAHIEACIDYPELYENMVMHFLEK